MLVRSTPPATPVRGRALIALVVGACLSGQTMAQENPAARSSRVDLAQLEEVIVTARKREERDIDVPQSLNVFGGAALESTGVSSFEQLQYRIPGVAAVSGPGNQIAIRGISNNASQRGGGPSTAVHLDGVYLPRPEFALAEVFDLGRVEVLKGPEGTLYGRNATAGVVNYISRDPGETGGFDGFVGAGSNGMVRAQAGVDIAAGDRARFRISGAKHTDDGYTDNLHEAGGSFDARDYQAARLRGAFEISPAVSATLTGQIVDDQGTLGYGVSGNPGALNFVNSLKPPQRKDARHIQIDTPPEVRRRGGIVAGQINAKLSEDLELKSITGYVHYTSRNRYDADGSGGFIENTQGSDKSEFYSQEFQLSGGAGDRVSWTSGLYLSRERTSGGTLVLDSNFYPEDLTPFIYTVTDFSAESHSEAVFGELTYSFLDNWSIVGGARYTRERIEGSSSGGDIDFDTFELVPFSGSQSESSSRFTPKLLLQYKPSRNGMVYASVTTGFKSGGINFNPPVKTYRPEKVSAYEIGAKTLLLDGALELNGAGFYYGYRDLQLRTVVGNQAPISNVAKATIRGVEVSMIASPLEGWAVDVNAAYTDSELKDYFSPATGTDLSGMSLPLAPEFSGTLGTQYQTTFGAGLSMTARAEVNRQSSLIFPALQAPTIERRGPVTLVNANLRFGWKDGRTYVALIGRNLTDRTYLSNRNYSAGFADVETYAAPRTYEVRIGTSF